MLVIIAPMTLFAVLLALLLDQARPLESGHWVHQRLRLWAAWSRQMLDAGHTLHGWLAWALAVLLPTLAAGLLYLLLNQLHFLLGFAWAVLLLYLTLGFRQFSHHFTAIRVALESGDEAAARAALARWKGVAVEDLPPQELLRQSIEYALLEAHRHVFGVLLCFVLLAAVGLGPAGALLYRMAWLVQQEWRARTAQEQADASAQAARHGWYWIDYLPVRASALAFAVVGNFEEAIANWRQDGLQARAQGGALPRSHDALLLAASAGAMNVRLGSHAPGEPLYSAEQGWVESEARGPQLAHLASVVGLVWRAVLLWLLLLALALFVRVW